MIVTVNKETKKYLKDRLQRLASEKSVWGWRNDEVKLPRPTAVVEAEKRIKRDSRIVNRFQAKEKKFNEQRKNRKQKMWEACQKAIHFSTPKQALALLDKFERTKF